MNDGRGASLRLYDPARDPAHWDAIIRGGEVALMLLDVGVNEAARTAKERLAAHRRQE